MPIEIRELIIRTHISDEDRVAKKSTGSRSYNEREIIERCIEKILRRLNKKGER